MTTLRHFHNEKPVKKTRPNRCKEIPRQSRKNVSSRIHSCFFFLFSFQTVVGVFNNSILIFFILFSFKKKEVCQALLDKGWGRDLNGGRDVSLNKHLPDISNILLVVRV